MADPVCIHRRVGRKCEDQDVQPDRRWLVNGDEANTVKGCVDIDLSFTPATNLLPIRRLNLEVGEEALVRAAWVHFPSFRTEVLTQLYRCVAADTYEYESGDGVFRSELRVSRFGFPLDYPGLWSVEASA